MLLPLNILLTLKYTASIYSKFRVASSVVHYEFCIIKFYTMSQFKIVPLSKKYAAKIRETNKDDFGHDVMENVATGKGPCRVSLKPFVVGEDVRLLLSHSPFSIDNAFNQP